MINKHKLKFCVGNQKTGLVVNNPGLLFTRPQPRRQPAIGFPPLAKAAGFSREFL
jgi:hypothetical protein